MSKFSDEQLCHQIGKAEFTPPFPVKDTETAAEAAVSVFGCEATVAVAYCAIDARVDGRGNDYEFWLDVFKLLRRA